MSVNEAPGAAGGPRQGWNSGKYLWITLAVIAGYLPLALVEASADGGLRWGAGLVYALLGAAVVSAGLRTWSAFRSGGYNPRARGWAFDIVDTILISVGVAATGGVRSEIWLFYFVLVASEALFESRTEVALLVGLVAVGYSAAALTPWRRPADLGVLVVRVAVMALVAYFARQITVHRERQDRETAALREQMASADERAHIARELHDGLGHALTACILRLQLAARLVEPRPAEARSIVEEETAGLRAAWSECRDVAFHLRPLDAGSAGFVDAVRVYLGRFAERTAVVVTLDAAPDTPEPGATVRHAVERVLQEALTNAVRHGRCRSIEVGLGADGGMLRLSVRDDGVGFDASTHAAGVGMASMRERMARFGGTLEVTSAPTRGAEVVAIAPVGR
ncbi:MAG: sensor histidine kinase [Armatimonadetes bacterium]|nr:sensor histidine kinase [Armatimonadota bacterium]